MSDNALGTVVFFKSHGRFHTLKFIVSTKAILLYGFIIDADTLSMNRFIEELGSRLV